MTRYQHQRGVTLTELSIVLMVIALIIGGVFMGQSQVEVAKRNDMIVDLERYKQSIRLFKDKYNAWPGDFALASTRWTTQTSGNGDGVITTETEGLQSWHHLIAASMLEVPSITYTGSPEIGTTIPALRADKSAGLQLIGNATLYTVNHGNAVIVGTLNTTDATTGGVDELTEGAFTVQTAYFIDQKMDDEKADSGILLTTGNKNTGGCTTETWDNVAPSSYDLTDSGKNCYFLLPIRFF